MAHDHLSTPASLPFQRFLTDEAMAGNAAAHALETVGEATLHGDVLLRAAAKNVERLRSTHQKKTSQTLAEFKDAAEAMRRTGADATGLIDASWAYWRDAAERFVLTLDALRERGDVFLAHEAAGCPPVLVYDYEIVLDGADLAHPCNYQLLRIVPPEGIDVPSFKRPYIIIDPRAGHGSGVGGFKKDSQVGVALGDGHPVYFVSFKREPVPGQSLADVTRAEAAFVREVVRRHPESPKPVITDNCQGGWASLVLAAANPDLTGPLVLSGAPVDTWAGEVGKNPMLYNAGILGGVWQPMFWSDMGGGVFDGAHLVMNFEQLNPGRNYFRKYYDLFADPVEGRHRFIEFERWWGGFFLLNESEIRWIVSELFVGNKLTKNIAQLEPGRPLDIKRIQAPIIVFASHGDNITPPQQALNWIADTYADEQEIRIRGQRIIYIVHNEVGHLGIFVSSKIAKKEHHEVSSTMKTIETLAPGLYEMQIDATSGAGFDKTFLVSFAERTMADIRALDDGTDDESGFAAVARASEFQGELYDMFVRPVVQAMVMKPLADAVRPFHPLRLQRSSLASDNPAMQWVEGAAARAAAARTPVDPHNPNPFLNLEHAAASVVEQWLDLSRDWRDMMTEMTFLSIWGGAWGRDFGKRHALRRSLKAADELRVLPEVQSALMHIASGGFAEALIRALIVIADSRGNIRRDRLERASQLLTQDEPFKHLSMEQRSRIIHEQTLIATFDKAGAISTLPVLIANQDDRERCMAAVQFVAGPIAEMAPDTLGAIQRLRDSLGLSPATQDVIEDPLRQNLRKEALVGGAAQ